MPEVLEMVSCTQCNGAFAEDDVREFDGELMCGDCMEG